ncbi:unnamed protein product [Didymodactylos carnosus]|uniref:Uncharacterized protein n=1 Tax=Didymodactylos carnosus TaxID=1234261 RepID=A0A815BNI3_9BILA|nr:unnamed protein product [Didymodactylos carnosus]CAF1272197.1 unnamed protein product [Didymodactylos carnosus]CAF3792888.1 unnamed protein product [Didymodactylos carnosus]CAF4061327.1 unnamed protein product [Didymodactylos carnosus]
MAILTAPVQDILIIIGVVSGILSLLLVVSLIIFLFYYNRKRGEAKVTANRNNSQSSEKLRAASLSSHNSTITIKTVSDTPQTTNVITSHHSHTNSSRRTQPQKQRQPSNISEVSSLKTSTNYHQKQKQQHSRNTAMTIYPRTTHYDTESERDEIPMKNHVGKKAFTSVIIPRETPYPPEVMRRERIMRSKDAFLT